MDIFQPENLHEEDLEDLPLETLDRPQLQSLLKRIGEIYADVEAEEPDPEAFEDPEEAEACYAEWEERLEALDDLTDEINDLLEG